VTGVSSGLGQILDSTRKRADAVKDAAVGNGPAKKPIPTWLIWTLGIGGVVLAVFAVLKFAK